MTQPTDDDDFQSAITPDGEYVSDRQLLLQEIKSLATEVARLRGDTKHLNEVVIPKEEHQRRRRVNIILAGLTIFLFSIAMWGLHQDDKQINKNTEALALATYERCLEVEARTRGTAMGVTEINALLGTLRDAQTTLAARSDATRAVRETAVIQSQAYDRYLDFVAKRVAEIQAEAKEQGVKPVPCSALKP